MRETSGDTCSNPTNSTGNEKEVAVAVFTVVIIIAAIVLAVWLVLMAVAGVVQLVENITASVPTVEAAYPKVRARIRNTCGFTSKSSSTKRVRVCTLPKTTVLVTVAVLALPAVYHRNKLRRQGCSEKSRCYINTRIAIVLVRRTNDCCPFSSREKLYRDT